MLKLWDPPGPNFTEPPPTGRLQKMRRSCEFEL
jgi:hypothetical protein